MRELRTRLIRNPAFQNWAAAFPFTRGLARREARALFDLCAGFVYSQVLAAFVQLRLPEHLANGPLSLEALARLTNLNEGAMRRLMRAAAALRLARVIDEEHYGLGDLGASIVGNPAIAHFIAHHALLYADLSDPVALLRGETATRLSQFWPYSGADPDQPSQEPIPADRWADYAAYSDLMAQSQQLIAQDILQAYPLTAHRCLLDVGGGEGRFIAEAAVQFPKLDLELFDLPPVAERARQALKIKGLGERVHCHAGDFVRNALPLGADIISLVRILHDHDDKSAQILLRAAYAALPKGGKLLIAEP
ncbi:MAG: methyltransferase, partial [Alphaproteobacteria bacterium]|nr:methyltransferase [Alphaproteobacteria bacterium]